MSHEHTKPSVEFIDVQCTFRHRDGTIVNALQDVSFAVPQGEFICVLGRSGHGKSTLLRALAGLQPVTGGAIYAHGEQVTGPAAHRPMVFQQDTVFPWMHVRKNVEFAMKVKGIPKEERRQRSEHWLQEVGLEPFASSWPRELSGGMRKRVALASVLATDADLWLMDEPFGSLDYFTRRGLHDALVKLWAETKKTVFFVTHDIEEALILADRILMISGGRVVDDMKVTLPRPRDEGIRATPEAVEITQRILRRLGVTGLAAVTAQAAPVTAEAVS